MKKNKQKQPEGDLKDSKRDEQKMKAEETTLDLPDVKDIPGQEHVRPPEMNEFVDVTIASDDEEGKRIFDTDDIEMDLDTNVSAAERDLLRNHLRTGTAMMKSNYVTQNSIRWTMRAIP